MDCKYLYIDDIKIDFVRRSISVAGELLSITPREFDVVEFLLDNMNKVVSRADIQEAVWGRDLGISSRTLDTHISRIRSKLKLDLGKNMRIIPVYAKGYRVVLFGGAMTHTEAREAAVVSLDTPIADRAFVPATRPEFAQEYAA